MHKHNELLVTDIPRRNMYLFPEKTAIIFKRRRLTHREFYERTNRLANGLINLGIKKGDRCAILSMNNSEYLECFYGIPKAGGIFVPLNYRLAANELIDILNDSGASILIYEGRFDDVIDKIRLKTKIHEFVSLDASTDKVIRYEQLLSQSSEIEHEISRNHLCSNDGFCLMYTSGTTGFPKGVLLTQRNMIANIWGVQVAYRCTHMDRHIAVMPLYHGGSLQYSAVHYSVGGSVVILEQFDAEEFFRTVKKEKVTTAFLVASLLQKLAEGLKGRENDIESLRLIFYGASGIPKEHLKKALNAFKCQFTQGYGMTELGPRGVTYFTPEDHEEAMKDPAKEKRLSSCGIVTPSVEIRIADESDETLPLGETGEICVRGEPVFQYYWNNKKETERALKGGWFHSGDLGYLDEDGFLYIVDRKKDMIVSGGENIYSTEVENAILLHPCVHECAVFGVPDKEWGESVHARVCLKPGASISGEEIVKFCKKHIASYKKPKSVEFVDSIPRNQMGKVIKKMMGT
ncbi:MAG: long-chain fatty acid--CoA ligase [Deltaproteobacteria bacterium]|nr:long-chain fatty acid--CoA ligase [Deltaproteobacteria bacterium]